MGKKKVKEPFLFPAALRVTGIKGTIAERLSGMALLILDLDSPGKLSTGDIAMELRVGS